MCVVPSLYNVVFCTRVAWACLVCLLLCKEEGSSLVSLQLLFFIIMYDYVLYKLNVIQSVI